MSKNFVLVFFGVLVFFAAQTEIFAQSVFDEEYSEIVQRYNGRPSRLPNSIDEYDNFSTENGDNLTFFLDSLKKNYLKRDDYWTKEKEKCRPNGFFKTKAECVDAMENNRQEEAGRYIKTIDELKKIFTERKRKLDAARKKFIRQQNMRTTQPGYRKIFKDSIISPSQKPPRKRTN